MGSGHELLAHSLMMILVASLEAERQRSQKTTRVGPRSGATCK